jgi:hypothetical protein
MLDSSETFLCLSDGRFFRKIFEYLTNGRFFRNVFEYLSNCRFFRNVFYVYQMVGSSETLLRFYQNTSCHIHIIQHCIHNAVIIYIKFYYLCSVCFNKRPGRRTYIPGQCLSVDGLRTLAGCRVVHKIGKLCRSHQHGILVLSTIQSY